MMTRQVSSLAPSMVRAAGQLQLCCYSALPVCNSPLTGSKSDGQRSPNDTVFLRMDDIPFIHEDRPENCGEDGE